MPTCPVQRHAHLSQWKTHPSALLKDTPFLSQWMTCPSVPPKVTWTCPTIKDKFICLAQRHSHLSYMKTLPQILLKDTSVLLFSKTYPLVLLFSKTHICSLYRVIQYTAFNTQYIVLWHHFLIFPSFCPFPQVQSCHNEAQRLGADLQQSVQSEQHVGPGRGLQQLHQG